MSESRTSIRLTELQASVYRHVTNAPRTTPEIAARAELEVRTAREGLYALRQKGLVTPDVLTKPWTWRRSKLSVLSPDRRTEPFAEPEGPLYPVELTAAEIGALMHRLCPRCGQERGRHARNCANDENERVTAARKLQAAMESRAA